MDLEKVKKLIQEGELDNLYTECPECSHIDDEHYQCNTCGREDSKINITKLIESLVKKVERRE